MNKKNSDKINNIIEIKIGDRARIDLKNVTKGNLKRNEWIEENKAKVFTVEQGVLLNGENANNTIFQLKEDNSEIKWLFTAKELKRVN